MIRCAESVFNSHLSVIILCAHLNTGSPIKSFRTQSASNQAFDVAPSVAELTTSDTDRPIWDKDCYSEPAMVISVHMVTADKDSSDHFWVFAWSRRVPKPSVETLPSSEFRKVHED